MKKIIVLFVALFLSVAGIIAQTSLAPGDLAFTSYTSDNPDEFSFVVLEDIDSATVISFTDHGWLSTGAFRTNENVIVWTSGVAIAKGTIIIINSTAPSIGSTTGAMPAFSGSGDQVFAFQGTVAMPSLIAGLNMDGAWVATATSSNNSALPTALNGFAMAIVPEVDNAYYDCVTYGFAGSKLSLFASLIDSSNWVTSNSLPNTSNCTSFNVVTGTSSVVVSITVDSNVSCNGLMNGGLTAVVSGGVPPYSFAWSNGDSIASISGLAAGTYSVVVTDSLGFRANQTVGITEPTVIAVNLNVSDATTIGGADGYITAAVAGGTPGYTFAWSNMSMTDSIGGLSAGTYILTVTDANGCSLVDSATVSDPAAVVLAMDSSNVSCFGAADGTAKVTASGGAGSYTYVWSNTATTDSIGGLSAGTYAVTVSDAIGTIAVDSVTINEPAALQLSFIVTNASSAGAADGAIDLTVTGGTSGYTFRWSNSATVEDLTGLTAGTYSVVVSDANGCLITDSAQVLEPGAIANLVITEINYNGPESGTDTSEFIEIANPGSTTVNLNGFFFSQGVTHTFTANDSIIAGQYYVIAFDSSAFRNTYGINADVIWTSGGLSNGGEDITLVDNFGRTIDSVDFENSAPWPVNTGMIGPVGNGTSIELQTALTSDNNLGSNWVASALAVPGVVVNGFQVFGSPGNPNTTGINTVGANQNELKIYPNPTKGMITIERANDNLERIQIISIDGKILNDIQSSQSATIMDLSDFSNGVYFLRIGNTTHRIVLAR